ncbi:unannotated protein [freshwater metagenome]|uniref:Unannotated protein n=1 Tax=freshwater metagenome TaxID=449393 RepID=A0A6J6PH02_9ZZZZ
MRCANCVDVASLHQRQLFAHCLFWNSATKQRVVLVTVHASELNRRTIYQKHRVFDLDGSETNLKLNGFTIAVFARANLKRVEIRCLGCPRHRVCNMHRLAWLDIGVGFEQLHSNRNCSLRRVCLHIDAQARNTVDEVGLHRNVFNRNCWSLNNRNITHDARQPPLVLVFEVRSRAKSKDPESESVFLFQQTGQIKLARQSAASHRAQVDIVEPDVGGTLDAIESKHRA